MVNSVTLAKHMQYFKTHPIIVRDVHARATPGRAPPRSAHPRATEKCSYSALSRAAAHERFLVRYPRQNSIKNITTHCQT